MSTLGNINEKALEILDFAQKCQRPDRSIYGTAGQCRLGTPTTATTKEETEKKAKTGVSLTGGESLEKFRGTETIARLTFRSEQLRKRAKESPADAKFAKTQIEENDKIINEHKKNSAVLDGIVANVPDGTEVSVTRAGHVQMDYTTKSGQKIRAFFSGKSYDFEVNGSLDVGTVTSRPQQIEVANAVRRNYNAVVKSLAQGAVVETSAWTGDGRGDSRAKAYERMGFSSPVGGPGGNQYARKSGDKMVPSSGSEAELDKSYSFTERKEKEDVALWFVAIFGSNKK